MDKLPHPETVETNKKIIFDKRTETILYILLDSLMTSEEYNHRYFETLKRLNSLLEYYIGLLRNIKDIGFKVGLDGGNYQQTKAIERIFYNLLSFTDRFLKDIKEYQAMNTIRYSTQKMFTHFESDL